MRYTWLALLALCSLAQAQLSVSNVTSSRALTTVYRNQTGHPLVVIATVSLAQCTFAGCTTSLTGSLTSDSNASPTTLIASNVMTANAFGGLSVTTYGVVPVGNYYAVTASYAFTVTDPGPPSLAYWYEAQLSSITGGSQSVVTGSRALGTVYQNLSSNLLWVEFIGTASGTPTFTATVDSSASPTTVIQQHTCSNASVPCSMFFPVLPNYYYKITQNTSGTLSSWVEVTTPPITGMSQNVVTGSRAVGFTGTYSTYNANTNAVIASISFTMSGSSGNSSLVSYESPVSPANVTQAVTAKHANDIGMIALAVNPQEVYAAISDVAGGTLQEWVEWWMPITTLTCPPYCGEKKRRAMN